MAPSEDAPAAVREDSLLLKKTSSYVNDAKKKATTRRNFIFFSVCFAASPCCVLSCMALATARLGSIGAYQSGIIYSAYTLSSVTGATYVVKQLGARTSILLGMLLYCFYVGCFILAINVSTLAAASAIVGAALGGVGGGVLWTAQGVYFSQAVAAYGDDDEHASSKLAGIFAAIYLATEAILELLPTLLIQAGISSWTAIFGVYSVIAVVAMMGMYLVQDYPSTSSTEEVVTTELVWHKILAAWHLLVDDPKMKYMIGVNSAFGFSGAFVHSFINGEVVRIVLDDTQSKYVGALSAWSAIVSSGMSLVFSKISQTCGKNVVQVIGCCAYLLIVVPFLAYPDLKNDWGWSFLIFVYFMYGAGRATFEGTLKAVFSEYFPQELEGAFSNIVLQSGLTSIVGFFATYWGLHCGSKSNPYCITYNNGTQHNVLILELVVALTSILAIAGFLRAANLHDQETSRRASF